MGNYPNNHTWKQRKWTGEDAAFLTANYKKLGPSKCAKALRAPYPTVIHHAKKLGLTRDSRPWTNREIELLIAKRDSMPTRAIGDMLGRTVGSVNSKLAELYRQPEPPLERPTRPWTKEEHAQFMALYKAGLSDRAISAAMQPDRTVHVVTNYRKKNGLKPNHPKGKKWTYADVVWLKKNYKKLGTKACSEHLGRTIDSIHKKAHLLQITEGKQPCQEN